MTISPQKQAALVRHIFQMVHGSTKPDAKAIGNTIASLLSEPDPVVKAGFGRPEMAKHIVARCFIQPKQAYDSGAPLPAEARNCPHIDGWDQNDPAIRDARQRYNAGEIEMCIARDGDWLILYAIPRQRRAVRHEPYFPAHMCVRKA